MFSQFSLWISLSRVLFCNNMCFWWELCNCFSFNCIWTLPYLTLALSCFCRWSMVACKNMIVNRVCGCDENCWTNYHNDLWILLIAVVCIYICMFSCITWRCFPLVNMANKDIILIEFCFWWEFINLVIISIPYLYVALWIVILEDFLYFLRWMRLMRTPLWLELVPLMRICKSNYRKHFGIFFKALYWSM